MSSRHNAQTFSRNYNLWEQRSLKATSLIVSANSAKATHQQKLIDYLRHYSRQEARHFANHRADTLILVRLGLVIQILALELPSERSLLQAIQREFNRL